jgi:cytoskeletal protein CcmA (bactofilin family)
LLRGVAYRIDDLPVLTLTELGNTVVNSSLETVGTLYKGAINNAYYIQSTVIGNPTCVTTTQANGLMIGDQILIQGSNTVPSIDGCQVVSAIINSTTFKINVLTTSPGTTGFIKGPTFPIDIATSPIWSGTHTINCGMDLIVNNGLQQPRFFMDGSTEQLDLTNTASQAYTQHISTTLSGTFAGTQRALFIENQSESLTLGSVSTASDITQTYNGTNTFYVDNEMTVQSAGQRIVMNVNPQFPIVKMSARGVDVKANSPNNKGSNVGVYAEAGGALNAKHAAGLIGFTNGDSAVFATGVMGCANKTRQDIANTISAHSVGSGSTVGGFFCNPETGMNDWALCTEGRTKLDGDVLVTGNLTVYGNTNISGNIDLSCFKQFKVQKIEPCVTGDDILINGNLIPSTPNLILGNVTNYWNYGFFNTFYAGNLNIDIFEASIANINVLLDAYEVKVETQVTANVGCFPDLLVDTIYPKDTGIRVGGNLIPTLDGVYDLGNTTHKWGDLNVYNARIMNNLEVLGNLTYIGTKTLLVQGNLVIDGDLQIDDLLVDHIQANTINIIFDSHLHGNLIVDGPAVLNGDVTVTADVDINGKLVVDELCVINDIQLLGNLAVGGETTLNDVTVNGALTFNSDVTINANLDINGKLTADELCVVNDTHLLGNLLVDGTTTLTGNVIVLGDEHIQGNLLVNGVFSLTTPLVVSNGGTGKISLAQGALLYGSAPNVYGEISDGTTSQVLVGGGGTGPTFGTVPNSALTNSSITVTASTGLAGGGNVSLGGTVSLNMPNVGTPGTYGSATQVPVLMTDAQGRVTSIVNTTISGVSPTGAALPSANIWIGGASNVAAATAVTGDAAITNAGVTTINTVQGMFIKTSTTNNNISFGVGSSNNIGTSTICIGRNAGSSLSSYAGTKAKNVFFGDNSNVQGAGPNIQNCTGIGADTRCNSGGVACGYLAWGTGTDSIGIGTNATAGGSNSISIGVNNIASGSSSISLGNTANSSATNSIAIGPGATTSDIGAVCIGVSAFVNASSTSIAIGSLALAYGSNNTLLGRTVKSQGINTVLIGNNTQGGYNQNSVHIGRNAAHSTADTSRSRNVISIGGTNLNSCVAANDSTAIGYRALQSAANLTYNTGTFALSAGTITGTGTTFTSEMVGGTLVAAAGNIFITGFLSATQLQTDSGLTVGAGTTYTIYFNALQNTAVGSESLRSLTTGKRNTAIGALTNAIGAIDNSIAIGSRVSTTVSNEIVIGNSNNTYFSLGSANAIPSLIVPNNYYAAMAGVKIGGLYRGQVNGSATPTTNAITASFVATGTTLTVTAVTTITLAIGQVLTGGSITVGPPAIYIVAQLTGATGDVGTYQVSQSQTAGTTCTVANSSITGPDIVYIRTM